LEFNNFQFKPDLLKEMLEEAVDNFGTATKFSAEVGVDRTYISKYMNKRKNKAPSPKVLLKISNNSSLDYIDLMVAAGYVPNYFSENNYVIPNIDHIENFKKLIDGTYIIGKNRIRYSYDEENKKPYFFVDTQSGVEKEVVEGEEDKIIIKEVIIYETVEGYHRFTDALEAAKTI